MDWDLWKQALPTLVGLIMLGGVLSAAFASERDRRWVWPAYGLLVAIDGFMLFLGAMSLAAGALMKPGTTMGSLSSGSATIANDPRLILSFGGLFAGGALIAAAMLLPAVRRFCARFIPIDPDRLVHAAALQFAVYLIVAAGVILIFLPLFIEDPMLRNQTGMQLLVSLWTQTVGFLVVSALGVGLFVARDWRATLERLGLTRRFDVRWWLGASIIGLLSAHAIDLLWQMAAPGSLSEVEKITDVLFKPLLNLGVPGILTIGLAAGLGEEVLFRGAAQPRLGLILTTLLFAAIHTQYTLSPALIQVFVIGGLLGLTRQRVNTTTSIAVHATYNIVLALLAVYAPTLRP